MTTNVYDTPQSDIEIDEQGFAELTMTQILFSFKGRIGRKQFWLAILGMGVFYLVVLGVLSVAFSDPSIVLGVGVLLYIPLIWASIAVQIKRWHDRDKSGWWTLLNFVPLIGLWALIETGFLSGTQGKNSYGLPCA